VPRHLGLFPYSFSFFPPPLSLPFVKWSGREGRGPSALSVVGGGGPPLLWHVIAIVKSFFLPFPSATFVRAREVIKSGAEHPLFFFLAYFFLVSVDKKDVRKRKKPFLCPFRPGRRRRGRRIFSPPLRGGMEREVFPLIPPLHSPFLARIRAGLERSWGPLPPLLFSLLSA